MYCLSKLCYICLSKGNNLQRIDNKESLARIIQMLEYCSCDIQWMKTRNCVLMCAECYKNLQITFHFIYLCRKNGTQMQGYVSQVENAMVFEENSEAELNVMLVDFKQVDSYSDDNSNNTTNQHDDRVNSTYMLNEVKQENVFEDNEFIDTPQLYEEVKIEFLTPANDYEYSNNSHTENNYKGFTTTEISDSQDFSANIKYMQLNESQIDNYKFNEQPYLDDQILINVVDDLHKCPTNKTKTYTKETYKCPNCTKSFTRIANLNKHRLVHKEVNPYKCFLCHKSFTIKANLDRHQITHTGEKPHRCFICNKSYTRNEHLIEHRLTHTGERPHTCFVCNRSFTRKTHLDMHFVTHTGEKPFKCLLCNKCFTRKGNLNQHTLMHTKNKMNK